MKLLFDQNLSPWLVDQLADLYPGSLHVQSVGLDRISDSVIWEYARAHEFVVLSKDEDFNTLSLLRGIPPKIIWLQLGNCTTSRVEASLRAHHDEIEAFGADVTLGTLVLH